MKSIIKISTILLLVLLAFSCNNSKDKEPKTPIGSKHELKNTVYNFDNPPQFRKDGELSFLSQTDNKELFKIDMEIASTEEERARGLMYRPKMEENNGMIFLFSEEEQQSFYMRNTIISLDIIYINAKREIVDIYKNTNTRDETALPSKAPAMYVVEVNGGICDKYGIKEGDIVEF